LESDVNNDFTLPIAYTETLASKMFSSLTCEVRFVVVSKQLRRLNVNRTPWHAKPLKTRQSLAVSLGPLHPSRPAEFVFASLSTSVLNCHCLCVCF